MDASLEAIIDVCVSTAMERIRKLDQKQQEQLLRDEMAIKCIAKDLPEVCNILKNKDGDAQLIETLTAWNRLQEQKISKLQDELSVNGEKASKIKQETEALQNKLTGLNVKLDTITHQLQAAVISADEEGEILTQNFYNGKISASDFLKVFHEKRMLAHLRKIKSERLLTITGIGRTPPSIYPKLPAS